VNKKPSKFSPEVRERVVRLVREQRSESDLNNLPRLVQQGTEAETVLWKLQEAGILV
jgi:predicted Zn-ribbon and HTH transcriptional regulator